jgi:hypothetical protein
LDYDKSELFIPELVEEFGHNEIEIFHNKSKEEIKKIENYLIEKINITNKVLTKGCRSYYCSKKLDKPEKRKGLINNVDAFIMDEKNKGYIVNEKEFNICRSNYKAKGTIYNIIAS